MLGESPGEGGVRFRILRLGEEEVEGEHRGGTKGEKEGEIAVFNAAPRPASEAGEGILVYADEEETSVGGGIARRAKLETPVASEVLHASERAARLEEGEEDRAGERSEEGIKALTVPFRTRDRGAVRSHGALFVARGRRSSKRSDGVGWSHASEFLRKSSKNPSEIAGSRVVPLIENLGVGTGWECPREKRPGAIRSSPERSAIFERRQARLHQGSGFPRFV